MILMPGGVGGPKMKVKFTVITVFLLFSIIDACPTKLGRQLLDNNEISYADLGGLDLSSTGM